MELRVDYGSICLKEGLQPALSPLLATAPQTAQGMRGPSDCSFLEVSPGFSSEKQQSVSAGSEVSMP